MNINFISLLGALLAFVGVFGPWSQALGLSELAAVAWAWWPLLALAVLSSISAVLIQRWSSFALTALGLGGTLIALLAFKGFLAADHIGPALWGFWCVFVGFLLATVGALGRLGVLSERSHTAHWTLDYLPPAVVPLLILLVWEGIIEGLRIPMAFFPRVSDVWQVLITAADVLIADSVRTFFKQVLSGYLLGITSGLAVGLVVAFSPFLRSGFLPLATAFSAIPIVGLAPVLGRAFGIGWESKAAVAVIVSFFPVVINVVQGLTTIDPLKLDLMSSYASSRKDILFKLRFPNALPYVFNALKIASIIVLISVIVSEFLIPGPPKGLGQRISLSARSGRYDVTFAAIAYASLIGILFYNFIALLERLFTSWHSSFRDRK